LFADERPYSSRRVPLDPPQELLLLAAADDQTV